MHLNKSLQQIDLKTVMNKYKAVLKDRTVRPTLRQPDHSIREWNTRTLKSMRDAFAEDNQGFQLRILARSTSDGRIYFEQDLH